MTKPKNKLYFTSGIFMLLLIVTFCIIYPSSKEIKDISNEINEQKELLEKLYLEGQFLKPTQKQYQKIEPQVSEFSKIFVIKDQELEIITALEDIAFKNNLKQEIDLKDSPEETKQIARYQILPITIKISGNYLNFIKYLINLEALDYYININDFRIFSQGTEGFIFDKSQPTNKNDISVLINADIFRTQQYETIEN